jgi:Skp family chaperone for outer membrane proteins
MRVAGALVAVMLAVGLAGVAPALAQEAAEESRILVVNFGGVLRDSAAATDITVQMRSIRADAQAEFSQIEDDLARQQGELTDGRAGLTEDQFIEKRRVFEETLLEAQRSAQSRRAAIDRAEADAIDRVRSELRAIVGTIARERGAALVLDRIDVIVFDDRSDISAEAADRLDQSLPKVPVVVSAP